jgi:hypothetical protein
MVLRLKMGPVEGMGQAPVDLAADEYTVYDIENAMTDQEDGTMPVCFEIYDARVHP